MDTTDFIYNINLSYDKDRLLDDMARVTFHPFNDRGPDQRGKSNIPKGHWFDNPSTWLQGHVPVHVTPVPGRTTMPAIINQIKGHFPEVSQLQTQISELLKCKDVRARYYRQEKNTSVPMHKDMHTLCAVNILLSDNNGPIEFEGLGEIHYDCAMLNLQKGHAVPPFPEERLLLKFSIFDLPYKDAITNYLINTTGDLL
jgi:hypothetical protein